jgi:hypothetical protein
MRECGDKEMDGSDMLNASECFAAGEEVAIITG